MCTVDMTVFHVGSNFDVPGRGVIAHCRNSNQSTNVIPSSNAHVITLTLRRKWSLGLC